MSEHDWQNLQFLLNADEATLRDWYDKVDADDHEYASEIMRQYSEELAEELRERHARIDAEIAAENDTSVAKEYLKKFTLGTK